MSYLFFLPQYLHVLPELFVDPNDKNLHKKVSGIHIIIYELVFKLYFRTKIIEYRTYELVFVGFFTKAEVR